MALAAALREYSGLWFGWSGKTDAEFTGQLAIADDGRRHRRDVDLEEPDLDEYYNGYANKTLWPLFHYRIDLAAYDRSFGEGYERVNRRFAETLRAADRARRPDLGARLPPDPAGPRAARSWASRTGSASSCTSPGRRTRCSSTLPGHQRLVRGDVRLRPGRLPDRRMTCRRFEHYVDARGSAAPVDADGTLKASADR